MKPLPMTATVAAELPLQSDAELSAQIRLFADLSARAAIIVLFSMMAWRFGTDFLETGRVTGLFLLLSEALVVVLTVARRHAISIDRSMTARVLTAMSMAGPPLLAPAAVAALATESVTIALSCVGVSIVIIGKITLGRSFALLPANRGIVSTGVYRVVRHPIYMGYLVGHVAYLLANPSLWNITALVLADAALLIRAVREEKTLALDPAYREYQQKVRWRVAPGIF